MGLPLFLKRIKKKFDLTIFRLFIFQLQGAPDKIKAKKREQNQAD
jgi:hypothetical protein